MNAIVLKGKINGQLDTRKCIVATYCMLLTYTRLCLYDYGSILPSFNQKI